MKFWFNKQSSRIFAILISIMFILLQTVLTNTPVKANVNQYISATSGSDESSSKIPITVSLNDGVGLSGIQFHINYDKNQFYVDEDDNDFDGYPDGIGVFTSGLTLGAPTVGVHNDKGYVAIVMARNGGAPVPGGAAGKEINLITVYLTVKSGAVNGNYPIDISDITASASGVTETLGLPVAGTAAITKGVAASKTITGIAIIDDIKVANGTALSGVGLPSTVQATLDDSSKQDVEITWDGGAPEYDAAKAGTYTFSGTLNLPEDVTNPNNLKASARVIIAEAVPVTKSIIGIAAIDDIKVANGTALSGVRLPSTVQATLDDSSKQDVEVTWDGGAPEYDAAKAGTYTFSGTLNLPEDVTNPNNLKASARVIVAAASQGPVFQNASLDSTNKIVTLTFDKALVANVADLKSAVKLATDGKAFKALGTSDSVAISSTDSKELIVTFHTPLTGADNIIQIAANSLKDADGNIQTKVTTTPAISGSIDECFIATAAYGSKYQPDVVLLRHFRDQFLMTNSIGKTFVKAYYHYSPPIARTIAGSSVLKCIIRILLIPFVAIAYMLLHPILPLAFLAGLAFVIVQRRKNKLINAK